jgi:cytochrome c
LLLVIPAFGAAAKKHLSRLSYSSILTSIILPKVKLMKRVAVARLAVFCASTFAAFFAWSVDESAANTLARKSGCLKCHTADKKKDGPSMKEIAAKWKGKPDAEQKLITHITSSTKVKIDGKEEEHDQLKSKDAGEIKNVIQWYLGH